MTTLESLKKNTQKNLNEIFEFLQLAPYVLNEVTPSNARSYVRNSSLFCPISISPFDRPLTHELFFNIVYFSLISQKQEDVANVEIVTKLKEFYEPYNRDLDETMLQMCFDPPNY